MKRHYKLFHGEVLYVQNGNNLIKVSVQEKLKNHIPSIRRFKCEICEISLQERGALNRHIPHVIGFCVCYTHYTGTEERITDGARRKTEPGRSAATKSQHTLVQK